MSCESWRSVKGYEEIYTISDLGHIKRIISGSGTHTNKILKPQINIFGYLQITLCKNGYRKTLKLHRLVLEAFIRNCPNEMECLHVDGNRCNNKLINLRWGTKSENAQDAIRHGTFSRLNSYGINNKMSKLTDDKVRSILQLLQSGKNGHPGIKWLQKEIAVLFNVHQTTISYISTGKIWKHIQERN